MSDHVSLINSWKAGDEKAAEAIYNLHKEKVYRLAYGLLGNSSDAEEALQDAITYALLNIHHFDEKRSQFTTWLHIITVSRCRDILRKRNLPGISFMDWLRSLHERRNQKNPEQEAIKMEEGRTVWKAVQELNPPLREAIILRHWGGYTYQEIADISGCPIRTAQSRVRLAYQQLGRTLTSVDQGFLFKEAHK